MTPFQSVKPHPHKTSFEDEDRLEKLFDRTHQLEREEELTGEREMADSLRSKVAASLSAAELSGGGENTSSEGLSLSLSLSARSVVIITNACTCTHNAFNFSVVRACERWL